MRDFHVWFKAVEGAVDLRGKTTIREAMCLIRHSKCFVGVVSSFSHSTYAVKGKGVVLFGPSTPKIWGHNGNTNIYKNLPCAPCIDILRDTKCPYGKPCMEIISVEEVKEAILKQISIK